MDFRRITCFIALGLASLLCCSCTTTPVRLKAEKSPQPVNLDQLVWVRTYVENPKTGIRNRPVTRFYSRATGERIEGIDLIMQSEFSEGLAVARRKPKGRLGYVDSRGQTVVPFRYTVAFPFHDGLARVAVDDKNFALGLIDRKGQWIVPPGKYKDLGPFREGRCAFRVGKRWGFLDAQGREVVNPRFTDKEPPSFHGGRAAVRTKKGQRVYIDTKGKIAVMAPQSAIGFGEYHEGLAGFAISRSKTDEGASTLFGGPSNSLFSDYLYGFIAIGGNVVVEPTYVATGDFSEGLAPVSKNAKVGFLDDSDPMEFRFPSATVDLWGYIDSSGKVAIPFKFNRAGMFSEGLARVKLNGKWGYVDKSGRLVIPLKYDWATDFRRGLAKVWLKGQIVFIDRNGTVIVQTDLPAVTF